MIDYLFEFPRELAMPGRRLVDEQQFFRLINKYNGVKELWASLYQPEAYDGGRCCVQNSRSGLHYCAAKIRLVWLDSDNGKSFEAIKALCRWADLHNIMHMPVFSGIHYQFYVFTKGYEVLPIDEIGKRQTLAAAQHYLAQQAGLSVGEPHSADIDRSIIGNIKQTVRVLNTLNVDGGLYCIPLTHEDIEAGEAHIRQKAHQQQFEFVLYGREFLDISRFAESKNPISIRPYSDALRIARLNPEARAAIDADKVLSELALLCESLPNLLLSNYVDHHMRYHPIIALKELGFSVDEANSFLVKYLQGKKHPSKGKDNYYSCVHEEKQLQRLYGREDLFFSHRKMVEEGFCREECRGRGVYL